MVVVLWLLVCSLLVRGLFVWRGFVCPLFVGPLLVWRLVVGRLSRGSADASARPFSGDGKRASFSAAREVPSAVQGILRVGSDRNAWAGKSDRVG